MNTVSSQTDGLTQHASFCMEVNRLKNNINHQVRVALDKRFFSTKKMAIYFLFLCISYFSVKTLSLYCEKGTGSVEECLTRDPTQSVACLSLTGDTVLRP